MTLDAILAEPDYERYQKDDGGKLGRTTGGKVPVLASS